MLNNDNLLRNKKYYLSERVLLRIRKRKLRDEIETALKLRERGVDTLKFADKLIHSAFEILKNGIEKKYPKYDQKDIIEKIKEYIRIDEKIQSLKKGNL